MVLIVIVILLILSIMYVYGNFTIEKSKYTIETEKKIERNFKVLHISDLHGNIIFYQKLKDMISKEKPDAIFITGDLVNEKTKEYAFSLLKGISSYPIYFVSGNHELRLDDNNRHILFTGLKAFNVKNLDEIEQCNHIEGVKIIGINDLALRKEEIPRYARKLDEDNFNIILMHQPEAIRYLNSYNADLVFAGHAHGGQWRIPFIKQGIFSPDQGIFPTYTNGMYQKYNTKLFVSRGVGTMTWIPRIFNRPHVIVVEIKKINNKSNL